ncbi:VCBS repeat-containing protein [Streptomyces sp. NBC_01077]|uniref:FG-GAP repeat domain-containing protein n=1 Tax=Streptomyces sp. NBC_01077 TaxID=2903746 RepID=UPI0038677816|nr:VCBS repeat-containing protein [Streptomyces sp. NBC_01077]
MQLRSTGSRLALAVTAVLAVTAMGAGTLATAPAAFAATSAPASAEQAAALPVFPKSSDFGGVGSSGFLTYSFASDGTRNLLWTPYDGGAATPLQDPDGWSVGAGDVVVLGDASWSAEFRSITLRNMAAPAAPAVTIDLAALNGNYVAVLSPTSVLAQVMNEVGQAELHVVTKDGATTTSRKIAGLPANATDFFGSGAHDGQVFVGFETGPEGARTGGRALVDVAAGTVTATYASPESGFGYGGLNFSASHVTWFGYESGTGDYITSVDRKTGEQKKTVLGSHLDEWYSTLMGEWLVYGNPKTPAKAVSLATGEIHELGVSASGVSSSDDGSAVLRGSRAADGDGLFRVVAGADGTPTVTKVAETGTVVMPLAIEQVHVPEVVNLDKSGGRVTLGWTLSRRDAYLDVTLTHIATGKEFRTRVAAPATGTLFSFDWDGVIDGVDAPNGKYGVEAEATPLDGVGEPAYQGWFMNLARAYNPHDYNDNGSTDVLARDASGVLWRDDLRDRPDYGQVNVAKRTRIGAGWGVYKQIEAVGSVGGAANGDVVAVDGSGVQWLYLGKGDGTFATRLQVGTGWQIYNKLAGGSDLDGDSRSDLVATDGAGVLWFYKGTGSYAKPFATRVKVGGGWQVYNQITAVGNIAGSAAGDLVARDTAGVLWLYQGNGTGGFAPRVRIGAGWGAFSQLVGAGDLDNDGRPDLIAYGSGGTYVYRSTGSVTAPFSRQTTTLYAGDGSKFNNVS